MDENRKKIIVNEILYWKESRMLPEQYCDYLLALYTEGNQPKELRKERSKSKFSIRNIILLMLIPIFVFLFYFTELSFDLQMALSTIFLVVGIISVFYFFKKGFSIEIPIVITAFILLLSSVEISVAKFPNQPGVLYLTLVINCLLWLLAGKKLNLLYFSISGYLGLLLLIISIFI